MKSPELQLHQQVPPKSGRRDFLLGLGRIMVLGGAIIAGYMIKKQRNGDYEPERCPNGRLCRNCVLLAKCNLPTALAARQTTER